MGVYGSWVCRKEQDVVGSGKLCEESEKSVKMTTGGGECDKGEAKREKVSGWGMEDKAGVESSGARERNESRRRRSSP